MDLLAAIAAYVGWVPGAGGKGAQELYDIDICGAQGDGSSEDAFTG